MTFWHILLVLAEGALFTVAVTLSCVGAGLAIGITVAMLGSLHCNPLRWVLRAFTFVFRGVPVLVLLFLVYFGLPGIGVKVPPFPATVISLGLVSGAYLAEIFRGAISAVGKEEILAAEVMGMTRVQSFRYIVLPQMLRFSIPGMVNEFTSVLKYTPFAYTVGIPEIMKQAMSLTPMILRGVEVYLAAGILYFVIYRAFLALFTAIEKRCRIPGLAAT
ncbi:MAG: amino acid ABC transporter permease [Desulfobacteraceae bacterium]|nr:MAG: amino acid ABC transporter permease [Desulfobacteraceae bacterium]